MNNSPTYERNIVAYENHLKQIKNMPNKVDHFKSYLIRCNIFIVFIRFKQPREKQMTSTVKIVQWVTIHTGKKQQEKETKP